MLQTEVIWEQILRRFQKIVRGSDGSVIVEFALILPVLLLIILGSFWGVVALDASKKNAIAAVRLADIFARIEKLSHTQIRSIFDAANLIYSPHNGSDNKIEVTSFKYTWAGGERAPEIQWQLINGVENRSPQLNLTSKEIAELGSFPDEAFIIHVQTRHDHTPVIAKAFNFMPQVVTMNASAYNLSSSTKLGVEIK